MDLEKRNGAAARRMGELLGMAESGESAVMDRWLSHGCSRADFMDGLAWLADSPFVETAAGYVKSKVLGLGYGGEALHGWDLPAHDGQVYEGGGVYFEVGGPYLRRVGVQCTIKPTDSDFALGIKRR